MLASNWTPSKNVARANDNIVVIFTELRMSGIDIVITEGYRVPSICMKMPRIVRIPVDNVAKLVRWIDRCRLNRIVDSDNDPVDRVDHDATRVVFTRDVAIHADTPSLVDIDHLGHATVIKSVSDHWL